MKVMTTKRGDGDDVEEDDDDGGDDLDTEIDNDDANYYGYDDGD